MKQCKQKRNLAFYKRSGEPWTQEQYKAICEYVGDYADDAHTIFDEDKTYKYIFDDGCGESYMYPWCDQENNHNFKNCKQEAYEDIFNEDGTVNGEQIEEEVTVEHAWQLAKMLEEGTKLTSDELADGYCYMADSGEYRRVYGNGGEALMCRDEWNIKTWRKVKPHFKGGDLVMFWGDESGTSFHVGILDEDKSFGVSGFGHYELYTGPVPKHIQDFIDELKAKEK